MTFSYRQLVIDDEIVRYIKHMLRGVRGEPERRAIDIIAEVGPGGHFTDHDHTVAHFRQEFWFSSLMERMTWEAWEAEDTQGMEARAIEKARHLISTHEPEPLSENQVREIDAIVCAAKREILG